VSLLVPADVPDLVAASSTMAWDERIAVALINSRFGAAPGAGGFKKQVFGVGQQ
jgi:hypothetical protein